MSAPESRSNRSRRAGAKSGDLRQLLSGGDRRSVAGSERVRALIIADPQRVAELASLARDEDWLVAMRAVDLLEKLAHERADWVQPFKKLFIGPLADSDKWELRLQVVRALPLLSWTPRERARVIEILRRDLNHPQKFVRAWALDSLALFAERDETLRPSVSRHLATFERSGSKALSTRAKKIRERLLSPKGSMTHRDIKTPSPAGEPYFAVPKEGGGPGVVVLHSWWGLTDGVRSICDRLAKEGFVAAAPDLYRGRIARTAAEARKLRSAPRTEPMWRTITSAIEKLRTHHAVSEGPLGAVGLSMGGHWALWFASRADSPITATVVFYAARASDFARGPASSFQVHLADHDEFVSKAAVQKMQRAFASAGRDAETYFYPGTHHWFFEPGRPEHDAKEAALAWTRMLAFLRKETARSSPKASAAGPREDGGQQKPRGRGRDSTSTFAEAFEELKQLVQARAGFLELQRDTETEYILTGPMMPRWKKELWFGGVRMGRAYVSLHLMPVYMFPELLKGLSPELLARMQGKSCFNFKRVEPELFAEVDALLARCIERLRAEGILEAASPMLRRPVQPMAEAVRTALEERGLMAAYRARPPYQRNDYLGWINRAKRAETKARRLKQMLDELAAGNRYMKMRWTLPSRAPTTTRKR